MGTVYIADGYTGTKVKVFVKPIQVAGELVKVRCAEEGKEYLIRWIHVLELNKLIEEQSK